MINEIFVNLAVADLGRSIQFFKALGFSFNEQFTDDTAACLVFGPNIYAMLLSHDKFMSFSPRPIADAHKVTEAMTALSVATKAEVDGLVEKAIQAGGREVGSAMDHGFMYERIFEDLDGHVFAPFWMNRAHVQG